MKLRIPTFGRADYDPNEVAKDGPFSAPRKWLHVQKVLIGVTVYASIRASLAGLHFPGDAGLSAAILAPSGILLFASIREAVAPTDPNHHTAGEHVTDGITDGALYSGGVVLEAIGRGHWLAAIGSAVIIVALYRMCRNGARP